jgi:hypothetical protein
LSWILCVVLVVFFFDFGEDDGWTMDGTNSDRYRMNIGQTGHQLGIGFWILDFNLSSIFTSCKLHASFTQNTRTRNDNEAERAVEGFSFIWQISFPHSQRIIASIIPSQY